ncbi:MAG: hypothetical protein BWK80_18190 [Desulfobacteraceae bacterium IS3]|nr:MAG: hypothetical protein BWK80_18190 [Desulfobacteraceae bacterium IS3]
MNFARIEMLFLIWAVPLLLLVFVYGMKRRKKILSHFVSSQGLKSIVPAASSARRKIKAGLMLSVLFFLALALSSPRYGYNWVEIERRGVDIILALDCSKSMLASDIKPSRLDRAKREVYDLLAMLKGDRVGLVAFAGTAFLQCPLTLDYEAFNLFLNVLSPDFLPIGGTDITEAINVSVEGFDKKSNTEKAVILITDGENTGEGVPIKAAEKAKESGVKLFCIGVGSQDGVPVPEEQGGFKKDASGKIILTKLDEEALKKMAVMTGGTYVRSVAGDMDLDVIYTKEIRGKMEASELESDRKQIWEDRYQWFLALAILALTAELFLPSTKKMLSAIVLSCLIVSSTPAAHANPLKQGLEAYNKGDYEKSLKLFIDAQLENPDQPEILYNVGNAYYKTGDFDAAASNFKEAMKTEDNRLKQKAIYNLGNANYRKEKFEDAVKNYEEAVKLDPNDLQAKQNLEFVKKVMELKKQQQEQKQQEGDKQKEENSEEKKDAEAQKNEGEKNPENPEQAEGDNEKSAGDKSEEEKTAPNYGNEKADENEAAGAKPAEENKDDEQKAAAAKVAPSDESKDSSKDSDDKKQAERMLNRLNDQPGKAMIPFYRKQHVEKDW